MVSTQTGVCSHRISDLRSRKIVLSVLAVKTKMLISCDLNHCFCIHKKQSSHVVAHITLKLKPPLPINKYYGNLLKSVLFKGTP